MVSSTLCPAVHILGSQNVYSIAEGNADHYWPWAVFWCCCCSLPFFSPSQTDNTEIDLWCYKMLEDGFHSGESFPRMPDDVYKSDDLSYLGE